jgi:hypothetical protein
MKNKLLPCICLLTFLQQSSFAQVRKYANEFLNIGVGSRSQGMGGAQIASVSDVTAGYFNPAGLVHVKENAHIAYMHNIYFNGIGSFDYLGIALPNKNKNKKGLSVGINLLRFAIDDIPNTIFFFDPDGKPNFNNLTTFSSADYAFMFSVAKTKQLAKNKMLHIGATTKVIHRKIGKFATAWGFGADIGAQYKTGRFMLAATVRDITTTYSSWSFNFTEREKEQLFLTGNKIPIRSSEVTVPRLILGAAYTLPFKKSSLTAEINTDFTFDGRRNVAISSNALNADPKIGLEYALKDVLKLRAGIFNFQKAYKTGDTTNAQTKWIFQPGAGLGFKLNNVWIDYAFSNLANQDAPLFSHVFTLKLDLVKNKSNIKRK